MSLRDLRWKKIGQVLCGTKSSRSYVIAEKAAIAGTILPRVLLFYKLVTTTRPFADCYLQQLAENWKFGYVTISGKKMPKPTGFTEVVIIERRTTFTKKIVKKPCQTEEKGNGGNLRSNKKKQSGRPPNRQNRKKSDKPDCYRCNEDGHLTHNCVRFTGLNALENQ